MFRLVTISTLLVATTSAFFFGGGGGGGCGCQPQPACAPPPPPAPCSGGNIVQGYVGAPQQGYAQPQGGYQVPQGGYQAPPPQGYAGAPQAPQGYQGPAPAQIAPAGGYQAPAPAQVAPAAPEPVQAGGAYADTPVQVAQVEPATQDVPPPPVDAAYQGEQEVVASLAREEPNYQNTGTGTGTDTNVNVLEASQIASELKNQAAAAAAKNAEVVEEDEPVKKTKEEGKTNMVKTVKSPATTTTVAATTEFPVGEEIVPDTTEKEVDISELHLTDDPLCNSDDLRKVVIDNIDDQLNSSKRMIQLAAEAQFGGRFDVICANGDFSYVTNTELYCQETKGDISCYTYRQL